MPRLLLLLALLVPATAHADPDPAVATTLSLAGTLLPAAGYLSLHSVPPDARVPMFAASSLALLVAPSAGEFYRGEYLSTGFKIRLVGGAAVGIGSLLIVSGFHAAEDDDSAIPTILGGGLLTVVGVVTMFVGAGHDVAAANNFAPMPSTRMFSIGRSF